MNRKLHLLNILKFTSIEEFFYNREVLEYEQYKLNFQYIHYDLLLRMHSCH